MGVDRLSIPFGEEVLEILAPCNCVTLRMKQMPAKTGQGTEVHMNRHFLEADVRIVTGLVTQRLRETGRSLTPHVAIQTAASSAAHLTKYSNITDVPTCRRCPGDGSSPVCLWEVTTDDVDPEL